MKFGTHTYGIRHIRHLWRFRKDFTKWHLFKCLIFGWLPLPDRIFVDTPWMEYVTRRNKN